MTLVHSREQHWVVPLLSAIHVLPQVMHMRSICERQNPFLALDSLAALIVRSALYLRTQAGAPHWTRRLLVMGMEQ